MIDAKLFIGLVTFLCLTLSGAGVQRGDGWPTYFFLGLGVVGLCLVGWL